MRVGLAGFGSVLILIPYVGLGACRSTCAFRAGEYHSDVSLVLSRPSAGRVGQWMQGGRIGHLSANRPVPVVSAPLPQIVTGRVLLLSTVLFSRCDCLSMVRRGLTSPQSWCAPRRSLRSAVGVFDVLTAGVSHSETSGVCTRTLWSRVGVYPQSYFQIVTCRPASVQCSGVRGLESHCASPVSSHYLRFESAADPTVVGARTAGRPGTLVVAQRGW